MKKLTFILFLLIPIICVFAQEESSLSSKEQKKLAKEKRNAERAAQDEQLKEITGLMLEFQRFVLEADYISGRSGERASVSSILNFIIIDSLDATIQLGSPWGIGINGVGGITLDGNVRKYELSVKENKKGVSYTVSFFIQTSLGSYDIVMWVSQTGRADATVRGNVSGHLTYSGQLVPLSLSRVYKGSSFP